MKRSEGRLRLQTRKRQGLIRTNIDVPTETSVSTIKGGETNFTIDTYIEVILWNAVTITSIHKYINRKGT